MDPEVFQLARQLQTKLERIKVQEDRDTFLWVHGFFGRAHGSHRGVNPYIEN